ncbi:MAG: protein-L-isoaspartate(D-aspartate) O-methyltransferase [Candidatus Dadabacteria bacterium]|nr:MAG: protein-L-isoaspartate(D-aspartate) O-methyltransferase [Candidatus Dadabacteria bacterium]
MDYKRKQQHLIEIIKREVCNEHVIAAMKKIPRHEFVPADIRDYAYENRPLEIGFGQTISQPLVVAIMTDLLELRGTERVLEIGTGSGYQTAILAELAKEVYTVELISVLSERAKEVLSRLGYNNVSYLVGNGRDGWKEFSPFDRIIVAAASESVPRDLVNQLGDNGKMVIPVGGDVYQNLVLISKEGGEVRARECGEVRFVPLQRE